MADLSKLSFNFNDLTLDEIELLEDVADAPLDELQKPGGKKAKSLKAMAYIAARRIDPDVTMEEVGKLSINSLMEDNEEPDPKDELESATAS